MKRLLTMMLLIMAGLPAHAQTWSTFLDPSRAIDWTGAGFTIPNYTTNCATQPSLTANSSSAAAANTTAIQKALASCDATHNVVNIPAGTYYVAGWTYGGQGRQVVRGAGPTSTTINLTAEVSCAGLWHGVCMVAPDWTYSGGGNVLPGGSSQCTWTGGYTQGSTTITLSNCGGPPPLNKMIVLDQANDTSDNGGVYMCGSETSNCTYETSGSHVGRQIGSAYYSLQQVTYTTGVSSLGSGSYSVKISPGVYFTNIRSSQKPGAWWPGFVQNLGIESLTLNGSADADGTLSMFSCYQCWAKNVRFLDGARNDVLLYQSMRDVVRDSYFYGAQSHAATSYTIESTTSSSFLIENNIFQQVTVPMTFNGATGAVVGYNYAVHNIFADGSYTWGMYASHQVGNNMNLFEGNNAYGVWEDNAWGASAQLTVFRNLLSGFQPGTTAGTTPVLMRANNRVQNYVGNVLGQPGFHKSYQGYGTSSTAFTGTGNIVYDLGAGGTGDSCSNSPGSSTSCDPVTFRTAMRWGNYDTAGTSTRWDTTEASPAAVAYVKANFTSAHFASLSHALPASLYHTSVPSWWPTGKPWPAVGPDVASGNLGICTGTYAGWQATAASQCTGGTLTRSWVGHAFSNPAQDCYLNVMHGPLDGTGNALTFNANLCYGTNNALPGSPAGLKAVVQ